MITYKFNTKIGILETTVIGEVSPKDFSNYIISLSEDKSLPKILKIFTDASKGRFSKNINSEDLSIIVEANNKSLAVREKICTAFILSSSFETALGYLYKKVSNAKNYYFNIFSTKEAALNWLNNF